MLNANLTDQLNLLFSKMYYESSSKVELNNFVSKTYSGDWGKNKLNGKYIEPVTIIRGTDFNDVANGFCSDAPTRYIRSSAKEKKQLIPYDILIEISGGSPTQSTGRSLLITKELLHHYNKPVLGTNFTRLFRCGTEKNAFLFKSYITFLYDKNVFFNYENGTTGIKNLDYKSVLKINVNDVRNHYLFSKFMSMFRSYEQTKQLLGAESEKLRHIKFLLLNQLF